MLGMELLMLKFKRFHGDYALFSTNTFESRHENKQVLFHSKKNSLPKWCDYIRNKRTKRK